MTLRRPLRDSQPLLTALAILLLLPVLAIPASAQTRRPANRVQTLRTITVEAGDSVNDVLCIACDVRVRGHVAGDIVTIGGSVLAEGSVEGDVVAVGGGVHVRPKGGLSGDVVAVGGYIENSGGTIARDSVAVPYVIVPGQLNPTALGSAALVLVNLLLAGLAYAALQSRRVKNTALAIEHRGGSVVFAGLLALLFFYAANSLCTRLGAAQAVPEIILGAVLVGAASAGAAGLGFWAANFAFPNTEGAITTLAGIFALTFLELVPLLGFAVAAAGVILSLGATVVSAFGSRSVASS